MQYRVIEPRAYEYKRSLFVISCDKFVPMQTLTVKYTHTHNEMHTCIHSYSRYSLHNTSPIVYLVLNGVSHVHNGIQMRWHMALRFTSHHFYLFLARTILRITKTPYTHN